MALEQTVKELQTQNAQFQAAILDLAKGQEEMKALLTKKQKKTKKAFCVINPGRRFRGPLKRGKDFEIPTSSNNEEEGSIKVNNPESDKHTEEEEDYYNDDEQYPPV